MGLFKGPSAKEIDAFAKSLAEQVARRYPPALQKGARQVSLSRITKVLEDTYDRAVKFHAEHKLGTYKKARLGNSFKWELTELGYGKQFVEIATEGMIVYLTRKQPAKTES